MAATEIKNPEHELSRFHFRLLVAALFVVVLFGLLAARLVHLQVFRHDELATQAEANRIALLPVVPNRGLIVDRNGVVLATNYSGYTLEITPARLEGGAAQLDSVLDELTQVVDISPRDRRRFKRLLEDLRVPAHPHPPHRRRGGPFCCPALSLCGRGSESAFVSPIPLGRIGQSLAGLYRPHQCQ
jgi:hypothetical protein